MTHPAPTGADLATVDSLTPDEAALVRALAAEAERADGVAPVSEEGLLGLDAAGSARCHVLARDSQGGSLLGYAQLDVDAGAAELVVSPAARRRGIGAQLWRQVRARDAGALVWAHGYLPAAQGFARHYGLDVARELWKMAAPADALRRAGVPDDIDAVELPTGLVASTYTEADGPDWVAVNARAFASHPEQGRMTLADVGARAAQEWFDPAGFILVRDTSVEGAPLAAFHWTKVEHGEGEVYVVGVDPAYQGRGLGGLVTRLGLAYLLRRGVDLVTLYVDGDNSAAVATYRRQGFERVTLDVQLR